MRKNIDIKEKDVIPLKVLAAKAGKDLKNYIQDLLSEHVKETNVYVFEYSAEWLDEKNRGEFNIKTNDLSYAFKMFKKNCVGCELNNIISYKK